MATLWETVAAPGAAISAQIRGPDQSVAVVELVDKSCLAGGAASLRDRSVALVTEGQLATALALLELDGVARRMVLCTPELRGAQLTAVMAAAETEVVLSDRSGTDAAIGGPESRVLSVPLHPNGPRPPGAPGTGGRTTEWVLLTSGTTAVPKLVSHDFRSLAGRLANGGVDGRRIVWSTFYDIRRYGGLQIFLRAMCGGSVLVLSDAREPIADFLARAGSEGVTHISGTPSHWRSALMSGAIHRLRPSYVRLSGEVADQALLDALRSAFPHARIAHAFASTEAGVAFDVEDGRAGFPAAFVHGCAGERPAGVELAVVDGTLRIRSQRNAARYLGAAPAPLLGADAFVDTGDLVELSDDRYLFRGRRGGVINVGGQKVYPEEVEAVLNADARVKMSLVRSRRNPITGAIVVAEVVLEGAAAGGDPEFERRVTEDLLAGCRRLLPAYKVPAIVRVVSSLELTAGGKLVRPVG